MSCIVPGLSDQLEDVAHYPEQPRLELEYALGPHVAMLVGFTWTHVLPAPILKGLARLCPSFNEPRLSYPCISLRRRLSEYSSPLELPVR